MKYLSVLSKYEDVLLPEDLMEILHIGRNTAYTCLVDGTIKSLKIAGKYRIPKWYLIEFLYPGWDYTLFSGEVKDGETEEEEA